MTSIRATHPPFIARDKTAMSHPSNTIKPCLQLGVPDPVPSPHTSSLSDLNHILFRDSFFFLSTFHPDPIEQTIDNSCMYRGYIMILFVCVEQPVASRLENSFVTLRMDRVTAVFCRQ